MEKTLIDPSKYAADPKNRKTSVLSDEKRQQLWLSDLCVKYGELSITPSASSLSSTCYSATDYEIDQLLQADQSDTESTTSWNDTATSSWNDTTSSYEYYWSSGSNTE